jgi:hypothetical protein
MASAGFWPRRISSSATAASFRCVWRSGGTGPLAVVLSVIRCHYWLGSVDRRRWADGADAGPSDRRCDHGCQEESQEEKEEVVFFLLERGVAAIVVTPLFI